MSDFFDGYIVGSSTNGDNDNGFGAGIAIAVFIFLYPYLPFAVVGYEIGDYIGGGLNLIKWGGALIGLVAGLFWYMRYFKDITLKYLKFDSGFKYWSLSYLFASLLFWVLSFIFPKNNLVILVDNLCSQFFKWAFSVS